MANKKRRRQLSGGAKMKNAGRHPILLGVTPEQFETLATAAALEMRPVTQFVTYHAIRAANRIAAANSKVISPASLNPDAS